MSSLLKTKVLMIFIIFVAILSLIAKQPSADKEFGKYTLPYTMIRRQLIVASDGFIILDRFVPLPFASACFLMENDIVVRRPSVDASGDIFVQKLARTGEVNEEDDEENLVCMPDEVLRVDSVLFAHFFRLRVI